MAVSQRSKTPPPDSPPKAKRAKTSKHQEKQLVCVEPKKCGSYKPTKATVQKLYAYCSSTMERAKEVQANLAPEFPSLVKNMLHSHVVHGFWLGLPKKFCVLHLPKHDSMITLEDEEGKVWETKYLAEKIGLSGGWRGFSVAHKLVEGDVVVFQLVSCFKFKVYIVRLNGSEDVDCALGLLELEAYKEQEDTSDIVAFREENESVKSFLDFIDNQKKSHGISDQSDKNTGNTSPGDSDGIRLSDSVIAFEEVRGFESFEILVNGLVINSEISKYFRDKYYELCCSQKNFLHKNILDGLNCKLVAGIISETVNIADGIRASKITTSVEDLSIWDKTLKAFEGLGMDVGFLGTRLDQLINLASKSKRYRNVEAEKDTAKDELRLLEAKFLEAKERVTMLNTEFETLGASYHELELTFKEVASAPW